MKTVALAGTFDTKGKEFLFVKETLESLDVKVLTIHTGVFEPKFTPDISNAELAKAAGESIENIVTKKDRAYATAVLSKGMEKLLPSLYEAGRFDGVLSFGGTGGTSLVTPGMRALPLGVPKIMVSTVASGNTEPYVGTSDLIMMPSVVDVSGLNDISIRIFTNACLSIAGMMQYEESQTKHVEKKPLIAATMFGLTTPAVDHAKAYLEERGYEVIVFHATGVGGRTMEKLISDGYIDGVLDLTTTEWADELVGGVLAAGPNRMEAAGKRGIPQVVSLGALDMVNFGPFDAVPEQFSNRNFYKHNPTVTLMRTTVEENEQFAEVIADKLNVAKGPTALIFPLKGLSGLDVEGQAFYGPKEDATLFNGLRERLDDAVVERVEINADINDPIVAEAAAKKLIEFMEINKGVE